MAQARIRELESIDDSGRMFRRAVKSTNLLT
jgi:hypothetical protein